MRSLFVLVVSTSFVAAQDRKPVTPADYASVAAFGEVKASPAADRIAYTLLTWDAADDARKGDLWVVGTAEGRAEPMRLTFDRANDRKVRWSADGKRLYFLGCRKRAAETGPPYDGKTQLWTVAAAGGEVRAVTKEAGGIADYDYAAKADAIFFSLEKEHADADDFAALRAKYAKVEYGHGVRKVSVLKKLDMATYRTTTAVDDTRFIREFAVTADGAKIAVVSAFDDTVLRSEGESRVDLHIDGKIVTPPTECYRAKAASPYAWLEHLTWNADGTKFAFVAVHDAYPAEIIVGSASGSRWTTAKIDRKDKWQVVGYGRALGDPVQFLGTNDLYVATEKAGRVGLRGVKADGSTAGNIEDFFPTKQVLALDFGADEGTSVAAAIVGDGVGFPKLAKVGIAAGGGTIGATLVDPNPHVAAWQLPTIEYVTWKAADGAVVGGVLELPAHAKPGEKLPLVVAVHGGPTTSVKADLNFDPHNGRLYFAAAGYAVLLPNYRGSTGSGDKFLTDLIGRENDVEVKDILAGIQHLVREGIADPARVGVMGWSNGGYLTNCLITLKDSPIRFKAASSGAGIVDAVAEWGFNDEPAYPIVFKKGLPWEQPELYRKTSPTYGLGNATTPTIVHVGGADERCPPGHSRMLYRALKENTKTPTELIVYTGEPHGLSKLSNRRAKMDWDLAWFAKYMK